MFTSTSALQIEINLGQLEQVYTGLLQNFFPIIFVIFLGSIVLMLLPGGRKFLGKVFGG